MVMDRIEAQKNIELYEHKLRYLQAYDHTHSSAAFKNACNAEIGLMKDRVRYLKNQLSK